MTGKRRYDGGPEFALEKVHLLAKLKQIYITGKAKNEAAAELPPNILQRAEAIRKTLLGLSDEDWKFCEENETGCVDVYRVLRFNRLLWVKIKLEQRFSKETVIVISFHHFDNGVPV